MQAVAYVNLIEASQAQGVSTELIAPMQDLMKRGVPRAMAVPIFRA